MTFFGIRIPATLSYLLWLALWELIGRLDVIFLIPPTSDIAVAAGALAVDDRFLHAAVVSLEAFAIGIGFSIAIGISVGIAMARVPTIDRVMNLWVNLFISAPLSALVPALMVLFGIGQTTVVVTVFLFSVWVVLLDTKAGVERVNPQLIEMARSFGAGPIQIYGGILVWAALPEILAGIRLAFILGVKGVIVGQILIAILGLGELLEIFSQNFLMAQFWAVMLYVFFAVYALLAAVEFVERRIEYYSSAR